MDKRMTPEDLRDRRRALGLSQKGLADIFDVKQATFSQWENGVRPVPTWVEAEVAALEDSQDALTEQIIQDPAIESDRDDILDVVARVRAERVLRRQE